jgi:hypothetical protein
MTFAVIVKAILILISVIVGLYILSLPPKQAKGIDYGKIIELIKKNPFKLIAVMLLLYSAYITLLYNNKKASDRKDREEYYSALDEAAKCRIENGRLTEKADSLTQVLSRSVRSAD